MGYHLGCYLYNNKFKILDKNGGGGGSRICVDLFQHPEIGRCNAAVVVDIGKGVIVRTVFALTHQCSDGV